MGTKNTTPTRIDNRFLKEIEDIKLKRITSGKDKLLKPATTPRLTLALTRHPLFPKIKQDVIKADLP
jgi:hypothetical protein